MELIKVIDHQVCVISDAQLFFCLSGLSDTDALQTHYGLLEEVGLPFITTLSLSVVNLVSFCKTFQDTINVWSIGKDMKYIVFWFVF